MNAEKCVEEHLNRSPGLRQALNLLSRALYGAEFHALLVHDARKARRVVKKSSTVTKRLSTSLSSS
ncbi:MAG: hypothetical protein QW448_08880 [Thermofilaceae archaeon]